MFKNSARLPELRLGRRPFSTVIKYTVHTAFYRSIDTSTVVETMIMMMTTGVL